MSDIVGMIVNFVGDMGYWGLFVMMFLESSFFPFPSEVAMIPAGYLASQGAMNIFLAWIFGVAGSVAGAVFNYLLAHRVGRAFLEKYGHYIFLKPQTLKKVERFFERYGPVSTFWGRLLPGIRQYISLPAGIGKMHFGRFIFYTALGAGIWCAILLALGYFIGENQEKLQSVLHWIMGALIGIVVMLFYYYRKSLKSQKN